MCLGVPMKLLAIARDGKGVAELSGVTYTVDLSLVADPNPGEHVIVHAGFAIEKVNQQEAEERLELFRKIAEQKDGE